MYHSHIQEFRVNLHIADIGAYFLLADKVSLKFSDCSKEGKGWNSKVENVTVAVIFCLTFRNMDTSNTFSV